MLIKVMPEQISTNWNLFKHAIIEALPPTSDIRHDDALVNVLQSLVSDKLQMWLIVREKENGVIAVLTTQIVHDEITRSNVLVLYTLYGTQKMEMVDFIDSLSTLRNFAKVNKCHKVIAYTNIPKIIELVKVLGGTVDWTLVSFEV